MSRAKTGFTPNTKKHLVLGAGAVFKNFTVGTDTYESATSKILGATQGGGEFKAVPTTHNVQIDGILGKASDLDVIDSWDVSLTVGFVEVTKEVLRAALGASSVDSTATSGYDAITGTSAFADSDYFTNITYVGTLSGSESPIIIQVLNAINMGGLDIKFEDGKEGVVNVTFEGRYSTTNQDDAPFVIYWPQITTVSST